MPIGIKNAFSGQINDLSGEFNGNQKKIENLYINFENDTEIDSVYKMGRAIGLFARGNQNMTVIKNLEISGKMIGKGHIGGIICERAKPIENCINNADITGFNMVGGIAGYNVGEINNCENHGKITITGKVFAYGGAGGIVGNTGDQGIINKCLNTGILVGNITGGIIGVAPNNCVINNCINKGKCSSGICDLSMSSTVIIMNCYNLGECQNSGIFGNLEGSDNNNDNTLNIYNSYNLGKTSKAGIINIIGSVARSMIVNIENVYNSGECTSAIINSILSQQKAKITIKNVYYNSDFSQKAGAIEEGIQGLKTNEIKNNDSFVNILNNNRKENQDWKKWIIGKDGYPTFE